MSISRWRARFWIGLTIMRTESQEEQEFRREDINGFINCGRVVLLNLRLAVILDYSPRELILGVSKVENC